MQVFWGNEVLFIIIFEYNLFLDYFSFLKIFLPRDRNENYFYGHILFWPSVDLHSCFEDATICKPFRQIIFQTYNHQAQEEFKNITCFARVPRLHFIQIYYEVYIHKRELILPENSFSLFWRCRSESVGGRCRRLRDRFQAEAGPIFAVIGHEALIDVGETIGWTVQRTVWIN